MLGLDCFVLLLVDLLRNNDYSWSTPSIVLCLRDITLLSFYNRHLHSIHYTSHLELAMPCFDYYIGQSSPLYFRNTSWCM